MQLTGVENIRDVGTVLGILHHQGLPISCLNQSIEEIFCNAKINLTFSQGATGAKQKRFQTQLFPWTAPIYTNTFECQGNFSITIGYRKEKCGICPIRVKSAEKRIPHFHGFFNQIRADSSAFCNTPTANF
jgi:hypothetical protein